MDSTPQASHLMGTDTAQTIAGDENSPRRAYDTALENTAGTRNETDSLGSMAIPVDAYWGIHTARALENFPITRRAIYNYPDLIRALARVKQACARANAEIGVLDPAKARVIEQVCEEIIDGQWHAEFRVGVIQGGAGTSTNMNANEVIANRGLEIMGFAKGDYAHLSPIDDVNRSQSTNDVYPTAIKLAMVFGNPAAASGAQAAHRRLRGEGARVREHPEDRSHPAAGCRSHDARPGVHRFRAHPR